MPAPPCTSGMIRPASPSCSASSVQTSGSYPRSVAICARTASSSLCSARNARIVARSSSCSSVNVKSSAIGYPPYGSSLACGSLSAPFGRLLRPRNVFPWQVLVDARLAGQAQHALAEDVAHDLRGAALDRVRARAQEPVFGLVLEALRSVGRRLAQLVARVEREPARAEHVDRGLPKVFVDLGHRELVDRALRAGVAGLLRGARALRREAAELDVDVAARHAVAQHRLLSRRERALLPSIPQVEQLARGAAAL